MVGNGTLKLMEDNLASNERGCDHANDSRGSNMARVLMNLRWRNGKTGLRSDYRVSLLA
jgi:hypothetical protein